MQHAGKKGPALIALAAARANAFRADWTHYVPPVPMALGRREFRNVDLGELAKCIDWGPFFQAWELSGPFPGDTGRRRSSAKPRATCTPKARRCCAKSSRAAGSPPTAPSRCCRRTPSATTSRCTPTSRARDVALTWHNLRQQNERPPGKPNYCLSDFVAPKASGVRDYLGAFAVTTGLGIEKRIARFEAKKDDYSAIMLKALADRLAEAFAEWLHRKVRRELWGYAKDEHLDTEALIREEYRGIRPAPGYPACPEHGVKAPLFALLRASGIGMALTENFAMLPAAAVSGFYLAHPEATYFAVGRIGEDQAADFARRSGTAGSRTFASIGAN